ncbi:MAG: DUF4317 domain-containing protein [bacterium]|nr:DUF4317 domain-containing protein [bacterium]
MNGRDLAELRRIWRKETLCCDRYAACYLDGTGGRSLQEAGLLLAESEGTITRHLALIRKALPMDPGNRVLQTPFESREAQTLLEELRKDRLCDPETLDGFFGLIQSHLPAPAETMILIYHAAYDIPEKGTDGADQGESDETYEHLLCLICPTKVKKAVLTVKDGRPALGGAYRMIGAPAMGFVWPAFRDRGEDRESMILYHAAPDAPGHAFWENAFGLKRFRTTAELRERLKRVFQKAVGDDGEADRCLLKITAALGKLAPEDTVEEEIFREVLEGAEIPQEYRFRLEGEYKYRLAVNNPKAYQLMDPEYTAAAAAGKKGERIRRLLIRAAEAIETGSGTGPGLVRELKMAADLQK